jgi:DNA topoisomerase-1
LHPSELVKRKKPLPLDYAASAKILGLQYVCDNSPGIRRVRVGKGFRYVLPTGTVVKDPRQLQRFRSLVIPPAWKQVWICQSERGHLQATGRDQKGRKQYRYHPDYREVRNQTKFERMRAFAARLPEIRKRITRDLESPGLTKTKVLATVVRLLESTCIRVGNQEYATQNDSFGLTTLRDEHVKIGSEVMRFRFKGKSGQCHDIKLRDRKLARIVAQCQALPGQELFQYLDADRNPCIIKSEDVNAYLREICADEDFTAKDFRTWIGTAEAITALEEIGPADTATQRKSNIVQAVKMVSERLGNRPATCRKYYIHPAILQAYEMETFFESIKRASIRTAAGGLYREERLALLFIEEHTAGTRSSLLNKLTA